VAKNAIVDITCQRKKNEGENMDIKPGDLLLTQEFVRSRVARKFFPTALK